MNRIHTSRKIRAAFPALNPTALNPLAFAIFTALYSLSPTPAWALDPNALPTGGHITAGSGSINASGNVMNVNQSSDRLSATWDTFNIGSGSQVNFNQPGSSSVALNRVTSSDASQIFGKLNANGQVYLINPSGILFGAGSSVNVGGLVASTLNMSDADFMSGKHVFDANGSNGAVINQGSINAGDGGYVALLGAQVRNEGTVVARLGSVMLGAGEKVTLDFNGDGLINMEVNDAALNASVVNQGLLKANGGTVMLSARTTESTLNNVVNNAGVIEATSLQQRNGNIILDGGSNSVVANSGTLNVSGHGVGETGGNVTMTGEYVGLFDNGTIDASGDVGGGKVLLGGDYQGSGPLHQAKATYMDTNATIHADAKSSGNGGKVILWSTDSTQFHGNISVRGGGTTGSGGLVETSGHALEVTGIVDLSAVSGKGGTWLIDPFNINITKTASSGATSSNPFTSSGAASSNLSSATLNASLSEGANILVYTTSVGGTSGDINVLDNVKAVGNATLTLQAHRNVVMTNTSISNASGKTLNVSLYSNFNNTGNGSVQLSNSSISTNGGNLTISGAVSPGTSYASTNVSGGAGVSLTNGSQLNTHGGNIVIRGATSSTLAANTNATGVLINGGSSIDAGGGNITIVALQGSTSGTGDAFILTGGSEILTTGIGSISIDSTNLGSGNGTRIFSTNNTIAATGSGNVTISGNATSGFGVLICSTAAGSSQHLNVGSGALTVNGNSNGFAGAGRGVYLATTGTGLVQLNADGGDIVVNGTTSGTADAVALSGNIVLGSGGGDIAVSGATSSTSVANSSANAVNMSGGSSIDAGGGNVTIVARQGSASGSGDAFILTGGSDILTTGIGSINIDSTNLGSGNGTRIFSTNNTIAATGSGNVTISGNATSGFGVLVCSTAAASSQNIRVGSGTLTVNGNSNGFAGSGRGVYLAASGTGSVTLSASNGGDIVLGGNSTGTYGTVLNSTGSSSSISLLSDGNITVAGNTSGGSTPGLGLISSGDGSASAPGSQITVSSTAGDVRLLANNSVINTSSGSFRAMMLDASGDYASIRLATQTGNLMLDGTSISGRGIDIAPSGENASVSLSTTSGDILLSGNSTSSFGGYGIFFNSTGNSTGVNVSTTTGNITLRGDSVGTSDAIALGGDTNSTRSVNSITSQSGNITLDGFFHSPNAGELDHGVALLSVTNLIKTGQNGNINIQGNATDHGTGVDMYGSGRTTVSVEDGNLSIHGTSDYEDGIGMATGNNVISATGSGSVSLVGSSTYGSGITLYPSGNSSSATISTNSGNLSLTGTSGSGSSNPGILIRSTSSDPARGVSIRSTSGDITLNGRAEGAGDGIAFVGGSNGYNTVQTAGAGNLTINGFSQSGNALSFDGGINNLSVADGLLRVNLESPNDSFVSHDSDQTSLTATGSGAVVFSRNGNISNLLTDISTAMTSAFLQTQMAYGTWMRPLQYDARLTPLGVELDRVSIDLALIDMPQTSITPDESKNHNESQ